MCYVTRVLPSRTFVVNAPEVLLHVVTGVCSIIGGALLNVEQLLCVTPLLASER